MAQYRAAIIGTGGISRWHARYYVEHPATQLVAGCDINPDALNGFLQEFSLDRGYQEYEELLAKEQPDLVSICTWHNTHSEIAVAAAGAGVKGILCEKPMAEDLAGARAMVEASEESGAKLAIHHQRRFGPADTAARELIAQGAIGKPITCLRRVAGGLLNNGSHAIDLFRYYLGDPAWEWVMGQLERTTNRWERGTPIEDRCAGVVKFADGSQLTLQVDMPGEEWDPVTLLAGPDGAIRMGKDGIFLLSPQQAGWQPIPTKPQPSFLEELIAWIEGGPEHRNAGRIAAQAQEIMMALYESARTHTLVRPPLERETSPLFEMIRGGALPLPPDEPYDIRSEAGLRYGLQRWAGGA